MSITPLRVAMATTAGLLVGCSTTVNMYPVKGPLSEMRPPPTLEATVDGIMGNTGGFYVTLPGGNDCKGKWASVAPRSVSYSMGSATANTTVGMAQAWSAVYGNSVTIANRPGVNRGEAVATCTKGGTLQAEFFTGSGTANGTGVARDTDGNFYKLIF